jgi:hypothetical protein
MNERIRELAEQAGFDVEALVRPYPGGFPREDILALESFAELIIAECVEVAHRYDEPKLSGPGLMIGSMIEDHFGIE